MSKGLVPTGLDSPSPPPAPTRRLPSLEPYLIAEELSKAHGDCLEWVRCPRSPSPAPHLPRLSLDAEADLKAYRRRMLSNYAKLHPSADVVARMEAELSRALETPPKRGVSQTAIALLLDTRTRQPPNPALYVEIATHDVMQLGYQPAVVVAACQQLRREATFTPEVSEIVASCRQIQDRYRRHLRFAQIALPELRCIESELTSA